VSKGTWLTHPIGVSFEQLVREVSLALLNVPISAVRINAAPPNPYRAQQFWFRVRRMPPDDHDPLARPAAHPAEEVLRAGARVADLPLLPAQPGAADVPAMVVHHLGVLVHAFPARADAVVLDSMPIVPVDHAGEGPHATLGRTAAQLQFQERRFRSIMPRAPALREVTGVSAEASPPLLRRQLGRQLRRLRERARIDLSEAAARLEWSTATLSRVETGLTRVDIHAVRSMLDLYGITGDQWAPFLELTRQARRKGWWHAYGISDRGYVPLEAGASEVREFALAHVPGLLQTEQYALAVFRGSTFPRSEEKLTAEVAVRMIRQRRLTSDEDPLHLVTVVDESVLRRPIGGRAVMRAQLRQVAELSELPNVTLHVLPTGVGAHTGMNGAFTLLRFDDPDEPEIAHLDDMAGARYFEKEPAVGTYRLIFEDLRSKALSPADSAAFALRLAEES